MEQSKKELIKEIADLFEDYEESYVPGEWESFQKHKKKKYPFFPAWIKVAAVFFLIVSVFIYNSKDLLQQDGKDSATTEQPIAGTSSPAEKTGSPAGNAAASTENAAGTENIGSSLKSAGRHAGNTAGSKENAQGSLENVISPAGNAGNAAKNFNGDIKLNGDMKIASTTKQKENISSENTNGSSGTIPSGVTSSQIKALNAGPANVNSRAFSTAEKTAAEKRSIGNADLKGTGIAAKPIESSGGVNTAAGNTVPAPSANQLFAQSQLKADAAVRQRQVTKDSLAASKNPKLSTSEFLLAESKKAGKKENKKAAVSKWDFGLQVMPTATHTNMNFGGGLVTAYHISDKISLSSGITLMQLGSGENMPSAAPQAAADVAYSVLKTSAESRQLLAVDASIKAIDIPLGLVYKITKHYYTSAGISYFNVLSEKRNNTYSETVPVNRSSRDPSTGEVMSFSALETQQVDEETTDRPLKGNSYLGFFNFSVGRRQNIFKQYNIQIEPFIKVPIGKLSSQDLNLMNSGIKFQLSF